MRMPIKYSSTLEPQRVRALKQLSKQTRIPQAALLDEAVRLLEAQYANDQVTPAFRRLVDQTIREDLPVLRRLAQ
jgi:hypothetical protein